MVIVNLWQQHSDHGLPWHLKVKKQPDNEQRWPKMQKKKRNPVGNLDTKVFDKEKLKEEVESYTDDVAALNGSELARRHNVQNTNGEPAKNGGQIIKKWLKSEGVDVAKFKRKHDGNHEHV